MSRKREGSRQAAGDRRPGTAGGSRKPFWIMGGSIAAGLLAVAIMANANKSHGHHPTPRPLAEQPAVVPASRYVEYARVARTYEMAATVTSVLDGLYCHCDCSMHSGHYSLLDCFHSDHGAQCDVCLSSAVIAHDMHNNGATLDQIRAEIDRTYGT